MSLNEVRAVRVAKLDVLKKYGMDPYPARVPRTFCLGDFKKNFKDLETSQKEVSLTGRIMAIRGQGAILFVVLFDGKGKTQVIFKKDELKEELFQLFVDAADMGDFISVTGTALTSKTGEESLLVKDWCMASKSLLPLPEKWHGLTDTEERYRKRYLDLLLNDELRDLLKKKAKFWGVARSFFLERDFLEVDTPTLEVTTGGAEAAPFKTHHNDLDIDVYLRISVGELWQKRLMAAGFPRTFEIGKAYRNEGSSPEHLQEFTNLEFYWSFADYRDGMKLVTELYRKLAQEVFGTTVFTTRGHMFDLAEEWKEIDYTEEVVRQTGIDINSVSEDNIKKKLKELGVEWTGDTKERLIDTLWKYCRKHISGPAFVINHPAIVAPLAKMNPDGKTTARFQPILAGSEIGNGYSELNDPIDQRARFDLQQRLIEKGDGEAMMADYEFVEMLEHGMPPTCGFGFGERLFAFFADKPLRELQTFPLMKPKG